MNAITKQSQTLTPCILTAWSCLGWLPPRSRRRHSSVARRKCIRSGRLSQQDLYSHCSLTFHYPRLILALPTGPQHKYSVQDTEKGLETPPFCLFWFQKLLNSLGICHENVMQMKWKCNAQYIVPGEVHIYGRTESMVLIISSVSSLLFKSWKFPPVDISCYVINA